MATRELVHCSRFLGRLRDTLYLPSQLQSAPALCYTTTCIAAHRDVKLNRGSNRVPRPYVQISTSTGPCVSSIPGTIITPTWIMDSYDDPFDGDEEAALRYAIALSLQDPNASVSASTVHKPIEVIDSDENEDDLENGPKCPPTPKKSSRVVDDDGVTAASTAPCSSVVPPNSSSGVQPSAFAALGLDRKRMEEERLARATKRKAPADGDQPIGRQPQRPKLTAQSDDAPLVSSSSASISAQHAPLKYPKGTVKKTVSVCI